MELHGNGWAEGLNKIYSCTPKVSHSPGNFADDPAGWRCTIFGANHSISNDSGAEESSAGVAQIINDHVCVTFADLLPDGASSEKDLDVAMARCLDACLHPSRVGSGSSVSSILGDLDFRRFCAASDNYLAAFENRAHSVAMVPWEVRRQGVMALVCSQWPPGISLLARNCCTATASNGVIESLALMAREPLLTHALYLEAKLPLYQLGNSILTSKYFTFTGG